jgi:hypothetical protein
VLSNEVFNDASVSSSESAESPQFSYPRATHSCKDSPFGTVTAALDSLLDKLLETVLDDDSTSLDPAEDEPSPSESLLSLSASDSFAVELVEGAPEVALDSPDVVELPSLASSLLAALSTGRDSNRVSVFV